MARKLAAPRPQDVFNDAQIARAAYFTATIFANRQHHTFSCDTRAEAEALALKMTAFASNSRLASVYAVVPEGAAYYVSTPRLPAVAA